MLTSHVTIGGREVAWPVAGNVRNLADISDYQIIRREFASTELGIPETTQRGQIVHHARRQTVWALVQKVETMALVEMERNSKPDRERLPE